MLNYQCLSRRTIQQESNVNWLDIVIFITLVFGFVIGWRIGLFGAIFTTGGLGAGVLLAARFSDNVAEIITNSISSDTVATVLAYLIILLTVFTLAQILRAAAKGILKMVFLGWIDAVGGITLGLVMGIILSGALITVTSRYSSDLPLELLNPESGEPISDLPLEFLIQRDWIQERLNTSLIESSMVPIFLDIRGTVPGQALGFVPDDFKVALDVLEAQVNAQSQSAP